MLAFIWKYFKEAAKVKTSLPSPTAGSLYRATFSCMAATKEIQHMIARHY